MATASALRSAASIRAANPARPIDTTGYWLSGILAVVAAVAAAGTALVPGALRGTTVMNGSARGTAFVVLLVAVPALAVAMRFAAQGSARAQIVWLGAAGYILYNSVLFLFMTPFNNLFLAYVAMMSLAIWSAAIVIRGIGVESFHERFSPRLPVRVIAVYLLAITALNFLAWMRGVVPAVLSSSPPSFLDGTGMPTSALYVQDLAFWLPLVAVSAVWLWRRQAWGYVIAGAMLVTYEIEAVGIAVDQWMGHAADPASPVASAAAVPMFAAIAVVGLIPLALYIRNLNRQPAGDGDTSRAEMTPHAGSARQLALPRSLPAIARFAIALEIFLGLGALFGGGALILAPDGHLLGMPTKLLAGSPFSSFLAPGMILFMLLGLGPLMAAAVTARRQAFAPLAAVAVGLTLIGWIAVEMVVLAGLGSLAWSLYLVLGVCLVAIGVTWWHSSPRGGSHLEL